LFFAAGIGKPQINELHVVFFDRFEYVCYRHFALLSLVSDCDGFFSETPIQQEPCPTKKTNKSSRTDA